MPLSEFGYLYLPGVEGDARQVAVFGDEDAGGSAPFIISSVDVQPAQRRAGGRFRMSSSIGSSGGLIVVSRPVTERSAVLRRLAVVGAVFDRITVVPPSAADADDDGAAFSGRFPIVNVQARPSWRFQNAWPSKVSGPSPKADDNTFGTDEIAILSEELRLRYNRVGTSLFSLGRR